MRNEPGGNPQTGEQVENFGSIDAPFVQNRATRATLVDRCDHSSPSSGEFVMQTEDTVASGSISSDKCDAPVQRRFVDRDRKGGVLSF
jgi:hypothetical protein